MWWWTPNTYARSAAKLKKILVAQEKTMQWQKSNDHQHHHLEFCRNCNAIEMINSIAKSAIQLFNSMQASSTNIKSLPYNSDRECMIQWCLSVPASSTPNMASTAIDSRPSSSTASSSSMMSCLSSAMLCITQAAAMINFALCGDQQSTNFNLLKRPFKRPIARSATDLTDACMKLNLLWALVRSPRSL